MSEENSQIVLRALEAWNRGDLELALSFVDPEIEVEVALGSLSDGTYHGHAGLTKFLTEFWREFGTFRTEPHECVLVGDEVLLGVRHTGTGKGSGIAVDMWSWQVLTIHSGKVIRWRNFRTRENALEASGRIA